jgi:hypothetical protein
MLLKISIAKYELEQSAQGVHHNLPEKIRSLVLKQDPGEPTNNGNHVLRDVYIISLIIYYSPNAIYI